MRRSHERTPTMDRLEDRRVPSLVAGPTITHSRMTVGVSAAGPSYVQTHDFVSRRSRDVVLVTPKAAGTMIVSINAGGTGTAGASFAVKTAGGQVVYRSSPGSPVDRFTVGRGQSFYVIVTPTGRGVSTYSLSYQLA